MYNPQLDTFRVVAELGSFSKASKKLFVTTSAVLQQINNLEEHLEVKLFVRTNQGLHLTPAGEYLFSVIPRISSWNHSIREQLRILDSGERRPLRVAVPKMHRMRFFYELWTNYNSLHPDQSVELFEAPSSSPSDIFKTYRTMDIVEFPNIGADWQKEMHFLEICKCPIVLGVPAKHPLASKSILSLCDLKDYKIVIHDSPFIDFLGDYLGQLQSIASELHIIPSYSYAVVANCLLKNQPLLLIQCSANIHPELKTIPIDWDAVAPYGFFYSKNSSLAPESFISFTKSQLEHNRIITGW